MQTKIDFTKPIIHRENNPLSQAIFEANERAFRGQCKTIMEAFLRGEKLTTTKALIKYGIGDLRRRIKDLKDIYGVVGLEFELINGRFKEWSLNKVKHATNNRNCKG